MLTSLTYAASALRMAHHGVLTQQLNAMEWLASAQVICFDKTGTLTDAAPHVMEVIPMPGVDDEELVRMLGRYAGGASSRNATLAAIADACPGGTEQPDAEIPFTSRRRWSAVQFGSTSYLLGAPELFPPGALRERAEREAQKGRRAVAFGLTQTPVAALGRDALPSTGIRPLGLVVFSEHLRPKTRETVEYFQSQGVTLKVLSGDAVDTVVAIAAAAGIESTGPPLDGTHLPEDAGDLQRLALGTSVVGRISPEGKRRMVAALREAGLYVTMIGDGVNDVPAMKAAHLAIAQGSGVQMAKSIADLILVTG